MQKLLKREDGFTLLELLIVIVIIGILALIIVPGLASGPKRARDTTRKADMRTVRNALETYYTDYNTYPVGGTYTNLSTALVPSSLSALPADPKNTGSYVYGYQAYIGANQLGGNCASGTCGSYHLTTTLENTADTQAVGGVYTVNSVN